MPLNPNYADWRFGWALVSAGDSRRAIEVLKASMRLDPFHGPLLLFYLGVAHFMLEEYTQALAIMRDFVAQAPVRPWGHVMLAMILAQLGQEEAARAETTEVLRLDSSFTVSGNGEVTSCVQAREGAGAFLWGVEQSRLFFAIIVGRRTDAGTVDEQ